MTPPAPRINTFMNYSKPNIDIISKIFIIAELLLGANRLFIIGVRKKIFLLIPLCYTVGLYAAFFYLIQEQYNTTLFQFIMAADFFQFLMCTILAFVFKGRLMSFYIKLSKFDEDIGFGAEKLEIRRILQNFLQIVFTVVSSVCFYCISDEGNNNVLLILLPMKLLHCFEMHYYGHLFILIIPRVKLIANYIRLSYPNNNDEREEIEDMTENIRTFKRQIKNTVKIKMKTLIVFYNKIITAFDFLYESIKWQVLIFIIVIFTISLNMAFNIAKSVLKGEYTLEAFFVHASFCIIELLPLLAPCVYAEQVSYEVRALRDLLSSRLYGNTLDKPSRSSARSLLALVQARPLSCSLLHMFAIDVALLGELAGLLLTYLIILLQFDKIVNPGMH